MEVTFASDPRVASSAPLRVAPVSLTPIDATWAFFSSVARLDTAAPVTPRA